MDSDRFLTHVGMQREGPVYLLLRVLASGSVHVVAIPRTWRVVLRKYQLTLVVQLYSNYMMLRSGSASRSLSNVRSA